MCSTLAFKLSWQEELPSTELLLHALGARSPVYTGFIHSFIHFHVVQLVPVRNQKQ